MSRFGPVNLIKLLHLDVPGVEFRGVLRGIATGFPGFAPRCSGLTKHPAGSSDG